MVDVASRCGAEVVTVEIPWGETISPDAFIEAAEGRSFNVMALVHAETSTGALQDLTGMRAVADQLGALLLVDAVTSLGAGGPHGAYRQPDQGRLRGRERNYRRRRFTAPGSESL
jgi:aspartate aminotransferase-like enzyme